MPAYGNFVLDKGYDADAAIVKYTAVKVGSSAEGVTPAVAATDIVLGIAQFGVTAAEILKGKGASVREMGISEVEAGAVITRGQILSIDASGRAIPAVSTARIIGQAITAASVGIGQRVAVRLQLPGTILA